MSDKGCTLTNIAEVLKISGQSFIPAQELTTSSSVTHEPSGGTALQLPSGDQATSVADTGNSQNSYIPKSPPHVAIQMDHNHDPPQSGSQTIARVISSSSTTTRVISSSSTTTSTAGSADTTSGITITAVQSFQLGNTFLGLGFQAAVALWIFRFQPQGDSTLSSFRSNLVGATIVCGFTLTLIGMLLRKIHSTAANISGYAGVLSFVLGFFLMMGYGWLVWTAAGILLLAIAYSIAKRSRGFQACP